MTDMSEVMAKARLATRLQIRHALDKNDNAELTGSRRRWRYTGQCINMRGRNRSHFGTHEGHHCQEGVRIWPGG